MGNPGNLDKKYNNIKYLINQDWFPTTKMERGIWGTEN